MNASLPAPDIARALVTVENSIREHAAAQGFHNIPEGQISAMVAHARGLMTSMPPSKIAALASNGNAASQVATASFSAVFAPSEAAAARQQNMQYAALMAGTHADDPGKTQGFFTRDAFGRTRLDIETGGTGYQRGEGGSSSNAYAGMDTTKWNPSSGGAGLTEKNFGSTRFPGAGLDLETTRSLFAQGFNEHQIVTAARDAKSVNLSAKESAQDMAWLRKLDPKNIEGHKKFLLDDQGREKSIIKLEQQIQAETDPAKKARLVEKWEKEKKEQDEKLEARKARISHPKGKDSLDHMAKSGRERKRKDAATYNQRLNVEPVAAAKERKAAEKEQKATAMATAARQAKAASPTAAL